MSRPSTSFLRQQSQDVDHRDKPGDDAVVVAGYSPSWLGEATKQSIFDTCDAEPWIASLEPVIGRASAQPGGSQLTAHIAPTPASASLGRPFPLEWQG